jgi:hypothetical protein
MKLHIFQSDHGDCLLLEGRAGGRVLCDGGMSSSMREHVRAKLSKLRDDDEVIDYAYVSHIDQDHISGVLQLLEDELEWRIYEHHENNGTPVAPPEVPRPPEIKGIWHNAFREQIKDNKGDIEQLLAAAAPALLASSVQELVSLGEQMQEIALSIPEAVAVSRYASPEILDIPINQLPGVDEKPKLLMFREDQASFEVGSMQFTIVGPTAAELRLLRAGWNNFLRDVDNRRKLRNLRDEIRRKVDSFGQENFDLRDWNGIEDFRGVTTPNIASLMFMVEEDGKRLLLTGDSQQDIILKGLELAGYLDEGYIHVDVLKVQHHGSENNLDENFCRRVSADHYVFCGNGSNGNPEQSVIEMIFESREGAKARRALAPEAEGRKYRFWFSTTSEEQVPESKQAETFAEIEGLVADLIERSDGKLSAKFNTGTSITLSL